MGLAEVVWLETLPGSQRHTVHVPEESGGQRILMALSSVLSYCLRAKYRMSLAG